jgi:SAM-dependent methyltransferase
MACRSRYIQYTDAATRAMLLRADALSRTPSLALDIGCEGGRWSALLADLGWSLICTDINEQSLALCQRRLPEARCLLVHPTDETLPARDLSLGLVLCLEVPPVLHAPWFLREVSQVLEPGGLVVGTYWNRRSYRALVAAMLSRVLGRQLWKYETCGQEMINPSYATFRPRLLAQGFRLVVEEGLGWPPLPRQSNTRLIRPFARLERLLGLNHLVSLSPYVIFIAQKETG